MKNTTIKKIAALLLIPFCVQSAFCGFKSEEYLAYFRGIIAARGGDALSAIKEFDQILSTDPEATSVYRDSLFVYWQEGNYSKAFEAAEKLEAAFPDDLNTQLFLASFYMMAGKMEKARDTWEKALKIEPFNESAILYLAAYYSSLNQNDKAIDYWDRYIQQKPDSAESYYQRGVVLERLGQVEKAVQSLEKTITLSPDNYEVYIALAQIYEKQNRLEDAVIQYEKYLQNVPENITARVYLGSLYYKNGKFEKAMEVFQSAEKINPDDGIVLYWLGIISEEKRDWEKAIYYFEKVKDIDKTPEVLARLSYYYSIMKEHSKAIEYIEEAIKIDNKNPGFHYLLGLAYLDRKDYKKAKMSFQEALNIRADFADAYFYLGIVNDQAGDFAESEKYFQKALEIDPGHSRAMNYLGYSYADKGIKLEEALSLTTKALEIEPENPAYLDSVGWVCFKQSKFAESEKRIEQAANSISDPIVWEHLGDVKSKLGKFKEAWMFYMDASELDRKNKRLGRKMSETGKLISEDDRQDAALQRFLRNLKRMRSVRCNIYVNGERNGKGFEFFGSLWYADAKLKLEVTPGIMNPRVEVIYNGGLDVRPEALRGEIDPLLGEFLNAEAGSVFKDLADGDVVRSVEGKKYVYSKGKTVIKINRKTGKLSELFSGDDKLFFFNFIERGVLVFPGRINFSVKEGASGRIIVTDAVFDEKLDPAIFQFENIETK